MIGRVKLKSKSAAFSISAAREGGAKDKEVSVKREMDLRVDGICWDFKSFGREICGICWSLGLEGREDDVIMVKIIGFEGAMIMLAMASGVVVSGLIK